MDIPNAIPIKQLIDYRQKLQRALQGIDDVLRALGVDVGSLGESALMQTTLVSAIKTIAAEVKSNITKGAILDRLRRGYPHLNANPQSVTAALAKLTHGHEPFLYIEKRGSGNQPTLYTTDETKVIKLLPAQINSLFDPRRTHGTGGWQSLFKRLQGRTDRDSQEIILDKSTLLAMRHYFFHYGVGGWQNHLKRIFSSHLPELFRKAQSIEPPGNDFLL
jgi:hypothetical protein